MTSGTAASGFVGRSADQWPLLAVTGVLGIVLGIVAFLFPGPAIAGLAILLGIGLFVQGIIEIVAAVRAGTGSPGRGWLIAFGVLSLIAGLIVIVLPDTGVLLMVWGMILWFLVVGVHDLLAAGSSGHRVWSIVLGVLSILVGLILLFSPFSAVYFLAAFVAIGFLFRGGADLGLALAMRRAAR